MEEVQTFNQLRVDIVGSFKIASLLIEEMIKNDKDCKYYFQLESGAETEKLHYQGWCSHSGLHNSFTKRFGRFANKVLKLEPLKKQYCFGNVRDYLTFYGYILKNPDKPAVPDEYHTNYTPAEMDVILAEGPEFIDWRQKSKKPRDKKESWHDRVFKELVTKVIYPTFKVGEYRINYLIIEENVDKYLSQNMRSHNVFIKQNLMNALTFRLEEEYPNKFNRKLHKVYSNFIKDSIYNEVYNVD